MITMEGLIMTVSNKIRVLAAMNNISVAEIARRLNTSPQSFSGKLKRESFTIKDLEEIANVVGVKFDYNFIFKDGKKV